MDHEKISYERHAYESVDDKILSYFNFYDFNSIMSSLECWHGTHHTKLRDRLGSLYFLENKGPQKKIRLGSDKVAKLVHDTQVEGRRPERSKLGGNL